MVHKTMQGRQIDLEKLIRQNELMPAIGNMKVNVRGDELGPGGQIIRRREDVIADYYENNPKSAIKKPANKIKADEFVEAEQEPVIEEPSTITKTKKIQTEE